MLIVSAVGTHKFQTPEEHALIVGKDIYDRVKVVDHNCDENLMYVGTSFRGNEIWVNKTVMGYDKRSSSAQRYSTSSPASEAQGNMFFPESPEGLP